MKRTIEELKGPGNRVYNTDISINELLSIIYGAAQAQMYQFRVYLRDGRKAMERGDHKYALECGMRANQYRMMAYKTTWPVREHNRGLMRRRRNNGLSAQEISRALNVGRDDWR